jgi:hypothetical protein
MDLTILDLRSHLRVAEPRASANVSRTYPLHTHSRRGRTGTAVESAVPATPASAIGVSSKRSSSGAALDV